MQSLSLERLKIKWNIRTKFIIDTFIDEIWKSYSRAFHYERLRIPSNYVFGKLNGNKHWEWVLKIQIICTIKLKYINKN